MIRLRVTTIAIEGWFVSLTQETLSSILSLIDELVDIHGQTKSDSVATCSPLLVTHLPSLRKQWEVRPSLVIWAVWCVWRVRLHLFGLPMLMVI